MPVLKRKIEQKGLMQRSFVLDNRAVNDDDRTVELSFSSETREVERWYGVEILDHDPSSIRLARLRRSGPLLFMHDWDRHLGVIEEISIEQRKGKAVVRFGNSALAEEKFQDVKDGVLVNVSVGYRTHRMVLEERGEDTPDVYRVIDWEPYEISLLTVAADIDVGVGRSAGEIFDVEIEETTMDPKKKETEKPADEHTRAGDRNPATVVIDHSEAENSARSAERKRSAEILSLGERYGVMDMAREFINSDKGVDEMRAAILEQRPDASAVGSGDRAASLDLDTADLRKYSIIRALNAAYTGDWKRAAFELECSQSLADQVGHDARGFYLPQQVLLRAMNATNASDLIANEHMGDMFIETLRPNAVTMSMGATVMDGLQGNVEIPRELSTPTFSWIGDDDDGPETDPNMGMLKMAPHTLAGGVPMSRRLLKQSSPSVEMVIQKSLLRGAALGLDAGALAGIGTGNQPMGITSLTGVNTQTVATPASPTWAEIVGFKSKVAADNAMTGKLGYVTTSSIVGSMETTSKDSGSGRFIMEDGRVAGHEVAVSNQLEANSIIYGNWEDLFIALWGVLDIVPDKATKAKSGGLVLRVFQDADVGVGHAESFCINA